MTIVIHSNWESSGLLYIETHFNNLNFSHKCLDIPLKLRDAIGFERRNSTNILFSIQSLILSTDNHIADRESAHIQGEIPEIQTARLTKVEGETKYDIEVSQSYSMAIICTQCIYNRDINVGCVSLNGMQARNISHYVIFTERGSRGVSLSQFNNGAEHNFTIVPFLSNTVHLVYILDSMYVMGSFQPILSTRSEGGVFYPMKYAIYYYVIPEDRKPFRTGAVNTTISCICTLCLCNTTEQYIYIFIIYHANQLLYGSSNDKPVGREEFITSLVLNGELKQNYSLNYNEHHLVDYILPTFPHIPTPTPTFISSPILLSPSPFHLSPFPHTHTPVHKTLGGVYNVSMPNSRHPGYRWAH